MDLKEFQEIKNLTYTEYCDYLVQKYGPAQYDYMTKAYNKNQKISRTKEGLVCHHKMENKAIMLSEKIWAQKFPFEYQLKENLVYCDYLEHLYLHVLICKYPEPIDPQYLVGFGGVVNFIVPELNDVYSGFCSGKEWQKNCYDKVINDEDVYYEILQEFINVMKERGFKISPIDLQTSFNSKYGLWIQNNNLAVNSKIQNLKYDSQQQEEI